MPTCLNLMIFLPTLFGVGCLLAPSKKAARYAALAGSLVAFGLSLVLLCGYDFGAGGAQFVTAVNWIDAINVQYRTGVDGLSLPLVLLTTGLSVLVVVAGWKIDEAAHAYNALYMLLLTSMLGVFTSLDLVLFYVFFEVSLLPMYVLIGVWGGPRRIYAAIKFFIYTLVGSICLLIVMFGLWHYTKDANNGVNTWIMAGGGSGELAINSAPVRALFAIDGQYWGFAQVAFWLTLISFMIKLPAVPFHTWLPDAHVEAPTPISMVLAGVLLKMGGYAMMRITYPFFPDAAVKFWAFVAILAIIAIIYGALCAMAQTDWKKLVAYSSVSHMGYVLLGLAMLTRTAFDGAYYQMIAHGISSSMMFFLVGVVYDRAHHRDLNRFGGIWTTWPSYSGWAMVGFFAGMGLPGLCGFIGEIMVLLGTFEALGVSTMNNTMVYTVGIIAASGVVLTAGYILWMFQRVYMGKPKAEYAGYAKVSGREHAIMAVLGVLALVFGIVPMLVFKITDATFDSLTTTIRQSLQVAGGAGP